jgi:hypothetical protein
MVSDFFLGLERPIAFETDSAEIAAYLRSTLARARILQPQADAPHDRATIRERDPRAITFNGRPLHLSEGFDASPFRFGFYGAARLLRESFRQNDGWLSFHAAAVSVPRGAIMFVAESATGKTTLALALLDRGARLLSDEFVFLRKADRLTAGYQRTFMIREPALPEIANRRVHELCATTEWRRSSAGFKIWHTIDPTDVYGPGVFVDAQPLAAIVVMRRSETPVEPVCEKIAASVASLELSRRLNSDAAGLSRLGEIADLVAGIPAYQLTLGPLDQTAELLLRTLG